MQIFLDCDGVLADFDKRFIQLTGEHPRDYEDKNGAKSFWKVVENDPEEFFFALELMPDAMDLYNGVRHLNPIILTGASNNTWAVDQKTRWGAKYFPGTPVIVTRSVNKCLHMLGEKHNVLIDDWTKHKKRWEEHGGTFIVHRNARASLAELNSVIMNHYINDESYTVYSDRPIPHGYAKFPEHNGT